MFRKVAIDNGRNGGMYLHSMPGRYESLAEAFETMEECGIQWLMSLTPLHEISQISPEYHKVITAEELPVERLTFPIEDYGVPLDFEAFVEVLEFVSQKILIGESVLIHCGAGHGRTGTFAATLLMALGYEKDDALDRVMSAGSGPETNDQMQFVMRVWELYGNVS